MSWIRKNISKKREQQNTLPNKTPENFSNRLETCTVISDSESNSSCLPFIDAIIYINLEHRTDRKEHCLNEIKKIDPDLSKTHRINAIYNQNGAIGCIASHIKALELFLENTAWRSVLILEDDFTFISDSSTTIHKLISYMFNSLPFYNVILLCYGKHNLKYEATGINGIHRILSAQTASGYIVNKNYLMTLLYNFRWAYNNMIKHGYRDEWCTDQSWKTLMPLANWYAYVDRIGCQYNNYSDIEKKEVAYGC
jgi:glycosyl transferase family 25